MKKQGAIDAKQRAANDKPNGGNGKAKVAKPRPVDEKYTIGSTETVKRGFLLEFCTFVREHRQVDAAMLIEAFSGRTIDKHKIDAARVHRYIRYALNHGQLKVAK
jgi:hypothetical protein